MESLHEQHEGVCLLACPLLRAQQRLVLLVAVDQKLHLLVEAGKGVILPLDPLFLNEFVGRALRSVNHAQGAWGVGFGHTRCVIHTRCVRVVHLPVPQHEPIRASRV